MTRSWRLTFISVIAAGALLAPLTMASAHDPEHDHSGPGSSGPDAHSQNMKLLANVQRSASATQSDLAFDGQLVYAGNYLGFRVIDIADPENPRFLYAIEESDGHGNAVGDGGRWHSAAFTWDGEVLALGWEPGGGAQARCQESNPDIDKSMFFYDAGTGAKLGQWTLPRAQSETENCTIHNYNMVPLRNGKYVAVGGHYQAGTWAVDFSDPSNPRTIGFSDPSPIEPSNLGGAWSTYWYNNFIYESEIQTGLNVFRLSSPATGGAIKLPHLNPQTQDFSLN